MFSFTSTAPDQIDYSKPIPEGFYILEITNTSYVERKKAPTDANPNTHQLKLSLSVVGEVKKDGTENYLDKTYEGFFVDQAIYLQNLPNNSRTKQLFIAAGVPCEYTMVGVNFQFPESVNNFEDVGDYLRGKQVYGKVITKKNTWNGETRDRTELVMPYPLTPEYVDLVMAVEF